MRNDGLSADEIGMTATTLDDRSASVLRTAHFRGQLKFSLGGLKGVINNIVTSLGEKTSIVSPTREIRRLLAEWSTESELRASLRDLREVGQEARSEEFPVPTDLAMRNADRLLRAMYRILPLRYEIYPGPDVKSLFMRLVMAAVPSFCRASRTATPCAWSICARRGTASVTRLRMTCRTIS